MSRMFSTSVRALLKWSGFDRAKLPDDWRNAVETFTMPGGGAEAKLGKLKRIYIRYRGNDPVHQSHFNPEDKRWVISAEISGEDGRKVCHIFKDGKGTTKKDDDPR
ncbi:hypothetical protein PITC_054950 [Penicillium italicum]|uniref:Uncharacterized protein n=1 Tax=Penicillium italicum TaxID=40296 RepID=A0A0A2K7S1_PENIT|nr:hypothetical protein PITC_054950 [Penicillium italicum]